MHGGPPRTAVNPLRSRTRLPVALAGLRRSRPDARRGGARGSPSKPPRRAPGSPELEAGAEPAPPPEILEKCGGGERPLAAVGRGIAPAAALPRSRTAPPLHSGPDARGVDGRRRGWGPERCAAAVEPSRER